MCYHMTQTQTQTQTQTHRDTELTVVLLLDSTAAVQLLVSHGREKQNVAVAKMAPQSKVILHTQMDPIELH